MKRQLNIVHLYAQEMNIYGDLGNITTLIKRLEWRGIESTVKVVGIGDEFDFTQTDLVFAGGGQDRSQILVGQDLQTKADGLRRAAEAGVPMLTICGTYQLFGRQFITLEGQEIPGIGIFKADTYGSSRRMIGNVIVDTAFGRLVGFENHSGQTRLDAGQPALGRVVKGYGNDGESGQEGAVIHHVYGTYLHGPILPKNPALADHLLSLALQRKYGSGGLSPLDDALELAAADVAAARPQ